uniref:C1q domain-containing protein n=1 Tax=Denticeps clupeoides TaxID=299321 RepID=A0AAY4BR75_9TELE
MISNHIFLVKIWRIFCVPPTSEQAAELKAVKNQVEDLQQKNSGGKVAFSAALTFNTEYVQAGPSELNLVFRNIITNVGNTYSSNTGFFTAPVKGVYFFRFTVADILSSRTMYTALYRNQQRIMLLGEYDMDHHVSYLVGGVTLQLEAGDWVNLCLPGNQRLYNTESNHCIFSGFLLFTL